MNSSLFQKLVPNSNVFQFPKSSPQCRSQSWCIAQASLKALRLSLYEIVILSNPKWLCLVGTSRIQWSHNQIAKDTKLSSIFVVYLFIFLVIDLIFFMLKQVLSMSRLGGAGAVAQLVADVPLSAVEVVKPKPVVTWSYFFSAHFLDCST